MHVSKKAWDRYKKIVNEFIDTDSGKQPFLWLRKINQPLAFGEDSGIVYSPVLLEGLFQYNFIKTWPNNNQRNTLAGELDVTDCVLYISANLLRNGDFLNKAGYWNFNWAEDRFILNGKVYQPAGDTQVAQASDLPLLFFTILQRVNPEESEQVFKAYSGPELKVVNNYGVFLRDLNNMIIQDLVGQNIQVQDGEITFSTL